MTEDSPRVWVVCEVGWEYDDQFYSRQGIDKLNSCFTIKELAEEKRDLMNVAVLREHGKWMSLKDYMYYDDLSVNTDILDECGFSKDRADEIYELINSRSLNVTDFDDGELICILKACDLTFYEIMEVDVHV